MRYLVPDFRDILKEDDFFEITNFGLTPNKGNYLLVRHDWKISFRRLTKARRCAPFENDMEGFNPVSFDDVLDWKLSTLYAFDVIGHLVSMNDLKIIKEKGRETKSIEFILEDLSGKRITCALWGDHAVQLVDGVFKSKTISEHVILLIHNAKLKDWKGNPQVSNQLFGSRIHINSDRQPILNYRKQLTNRDDDEIPLSYIDNTPTTVVKHELEYYKDTPIKTVDYVRSYMELGEFVVRANVLKVVLDEGWFTYSCKQCGRRAHIVDVADKFVKKYDCVQCGPIDEAIGKIRTVLRVEDSSGSLSVVLFDRQLSKLINRSVVWLNNKVLNVKDPDVVPPEIQSLVGLELIFKISVSQINIKYQYPGYTVSRVTDDDEVVAYVKSKMPMDICDEVDNQIPDMTPDGKVCRKETLDDTPNSSSSEISPVPLSLKRKSESPSSVDNSAISKAKLNSGIAGLMIGRMDDL